MTSSTTVVLHAIREGLLLVLLLSAPPLIASMVTGFVVGRCAAVFASAFRADAGGDVLGDFAFLSRARARVADRRPRPSVAG